VRQVANYRRAPTESAGSQAKHIKTLPIKDPRRIVTAPSGPATDHASALPVRPLAPGEPFAADFVLAGHGVIDGGAVDALNAFAERTGLGVLNTFTSKGVFRWDSPYHLGTGC
jgi:hypothetical protein